MSITETMTVAEVAAGLPAAIRVFERHHIDFCCGGRKTLRDACQERGLTVAELMEAVEGEAARTPAGDRDWTTEPLPALIDHIIRAFHGGLRAEMPRLEVMAAKVATAHADKMPALRRLAEVLGQLSAELNDHMWKEEHVLFPAIRAMASGAADARPWIAAPIQVIEAEHDRAGALLDEMRRTTGGYAAPQWGCATVRALYEGLDRLERDMHVHVHLENNVLFPRAIDHVRGTRLN